jgi:hypothetical protein
MMAFILFFLLLMACTSAFVPQPPLGHQNIYRPIHDFPLFAKGITQIEPITLNQDQIDAMDNFASQVNEVLSKSTAVLEDEFISFTLKGPRTPRKTKSMNDSQRIKVDEQKKHLLGRMKEVKGRLITLRDKKKNKQKGSSESSSLFLQLTIKFFGATDVAKNWALNDNDLDIKQEMTQLLFGEGDSSTISEWGKVQSKKELNFHFLELELSNGTFKVDMISKAKSKSKFIPTTEKEKKAKKKTNETLSHDKAKNFLLSPTALFFQRLGLTDTNGKPKKAKSSKLRQCQKFVEVVSGLVNDSSLSSISSDKLQTGADKPSIITHDMGCGRGYLTFALHSHLYDRFNDKLDIQSRGVDMRPKLVKEINTIASELGQEFDGLRFMTGAIENVDTNNDIDILIALHACDTATDDTIWYGIQKKASIIVTAPCCHKEVRRYLDAHVAKIKNSDHPYAEVLRHNIYKERIAETVTDSMRALLLEIADYNVQVFEFIGGEHTNKNVMITATKRKKPRSSSQKKELRSRLHSLAQLHGVDKQKLAVLMNETLGTGVTSIDKHAKNIAMTGMPLL